MENTWTMPSPRTTRFAETTVARIRVYITCNATLVTINVSLASQEGWKEKELRNWTDCYFKMYPSASTQLLKCITSKIEIRFIFIPLDLFIKLGKYRSEMCRGTVSAKFLYEAAVAFTSFTRQILVIKDRGASRFTFPIFRHWFLRNVNYNTNCILRISQMCFWSITGRVPGRMTTLAVRYRKRSTDNRCAVLTAGPTWVRRPFGALNYAPRKEVRFVNQRTLYLW